MALARIRRNPLSSIALMLLMGIGSATAGAGVATLVETVGATERLFTLAKAPDAVQMHVGAVEARELDAFAAEHHDLIDDHQNQVALQLDNLDLRIDGDSDVARAGVMDLLLVTQNPRFDFLVGADGRPVVVDEGEIAVPDYYAQAYALERGDRIELAVGDGVEAYTVSHIVRDAQMGPSLVNSKRFVVSAADWNHLAATLPQEHILTFRLSDGAGERFAEAYRLGDLPANGAAVDGELLRLIGALTDGLVSILSILVSIVLLAITMLCLRIMVLTALEEDVRRIGLLRALGFSHRQVTRMLLLGYGLHAAAGLLIALVLVGPVTMILAGDGRAPLTGGQAMPADLAALLTVIVTSALPLALAAQLLRRVRGISPLTALVQPRVSPTTRRPRGLRWDRAFPVSARLALRGLTTRRTTAALLIAMVACGVVLSSMPGRVTQTIAAPEFVTAMGVGQSDIRAFIRGGADDDASVRLERSLQADPDVERFASATSFRVDLVGSERSESTESIALEVGDASLFPLTYARGSGPMRPGEVALSTLAAQSAGVDVGNSVELSAGGAAQRYRVTGIYHDITNGGRSGKTVSFDQDAGSALWHTVMIDVRGGVDPNTKASTWAQQHSAATFTELDRFVHYTLGDTVDRLRTASLIAWAAAVTVMFLVFALRGRLESARDDSSLRLLRLLGWPVAALRRIALLRAAGVATIGLLLGWIVTEALGPAVLGATLSSFGGGATALVAPNASFVVPGVAVAIAAVVGTLLATAAAPPLRNES